MRAGILAAGLVAAGLLAAGPALASPATPPTGYGAGSGYCTSYSGGVTSSYSFDNVYACEGSTTGSTTFDEPGSGVYAWQCVELSARFLWAIDGIWAGPGSGVEDGADLVSVVHSNYPKIAVSTPGPGSVPAAGDVISLGPYGGTSGSDGHTAVVISANASTGQFEIMSENAPIGAAGEQALQVDLSGGHNGEVLFYGVWTTASWLDLASTTSITSPPLPGGNLLQHASFENNNWGGWQALPASSSDVVNIQAYAASGLPEGQYYLESNTSAAGGSIYQDVPADLSPGQSYTFATWIRVHSASSKTRAKVCLVLWGIGSSNQNGQTCKTITTAWTWIAAPYDVNTTGQTALRAQLYEDTTGTNIDLDGTQLVNR